jgi:hypothetical protein
MSVGFTSSWFYLNDNTITSINQIGSNSISLKMHREELRDLYIPLNNLGVLKSRRMECARD